ncbi:MAG: ThiF family adenylyltransferase [Bacteroidaceae bacterium]|nr:ThiF family adenylyltransferase [Bacteroidaceae bacterium]
MDNFSDIYSRNIENEVVLKIEKQLRSYQSTVFGDNFSFVKTPMNKLGVLAKVHIDAGSDSLLLSNEPVLIEFSSIDNIEDTIISIYPDRTDFPFDCFPHINYPVGNMPPSLCLTREDFCNWYSEHTFEDLINTMINWFEDANKGNLIKLSDGDYYEPFRHHDIKEFLLKVPIEETFIEKFNLSGSIVFPIYKLDNDMEVYSDSNNSNKFNSALKILLYRDAKNVLRKWFIKYPQTYGDLKNFITSNDFIFDLQEIVYKNKLYTEDIKKLFFQLAFIRPVKVLNKSTKVDSLYFSVSIEDIKTMGQNAPVFEVCVQDYATVELAKYISATSRTIENKKILLLGCGAIGSKIAYHLYRSGICNITICDNDTMESHNVVRHALSHSGFWQTKVNMVKADLAKMFRFSLDQVIAIEEDINQWLPKQNLDTFDVIIDATASARVLHTVNQLVNHKSIPVVRFALSDAGNIGLTYVNYNRNCNLTDYYMCLLMNAVNKDDDLSTWISKESSYNYDHVRVGEGCHSNTMILSDDVISTHSGIASSIIRDMFNKKTFTNTAYLSFANIDYTGQVFTEQYEIPDFKCITCENESSWQVRFPESLFADIRHIAKVARYKEIGGYLMGVVDLKHKTIYILNHFESKSSIGKNSKLQLSTDGWKAHYDNIRKRTCNNMTYIGDWHSHPTGSLNLSKIDKATNMEILSQEIEPLYGVCVITNSKSTNFYLLKPEDK